MSPWYSTHNHKRKRTKTKWIESTNGRMNSVHTFEKCLLWLSWIITLFGFCVKCQCVLVYCVDATPLKWVSLCSENRPFYLSCFINSKSHHACNTNVRISFTKQKVLQSLQRDTFHSVNSHERDRENERWKSRFSLVAAIHSRYTLIAPEYE